MEENHKITWEVTGIVLTALIAKLRQSSECQNELLELIEPDRNYSPKEYKRPLPNLKRP